MSKGTDNSSSGDSKMNVSTSGNRNGNSIATSKTFQDYILFWIGQLFSMFGSMVVYFAITWWITIETESPIALAWASFFFVMPAIAIMMFAGVLSDRWDRKKIILTVDSLQAFATFLLIVLIWSGVANLIIIYVFIAIRSAFQAFHVPTVNAVIPTMVPKKHLARINGINFLFTGVVQIIAPFTAAILLNFFTMEQLLWVDIITFFVALVPLLLIKIPSVRSVQSTDQFTVVNLDGTSEAATEKQDAGKKESFFGQFKLGFKTLMVIPGLLTLLLLSMLLNFLVRPLDVLLPYFVSVTHGGNEFTYALATGIFQAGMIIGAVITVIKGDWKNNMRTIFIAIMIAVIGYGIMAIAPQGWFLEVDGIGVQPMMFLLVGGIGGFILGFSLPIINALYQTIMQKIVPADKLGRVTAIDMTMSNIISPVAVLLSGPLAEIMGVANLYLICALLGLGATVLTWTFSGIRKVNYDSPEMIESITASINSVSM